MNNIFSKTKAPKTVGIIMDGNRRWAKAKNLAVYEGHHAGYEKLKDFAKWAREAGVKNVIAFAFSTENWERKKHEVDFLLALFRRMVIEEAEELKKEKARIVFLGDLDRFPRDIVMAARKLEEETAKFAKNQTIGLAVSYSGRSEIISAIKKLVKEKGVSAIQKLDEKMFSSFLFTKDIPDPDLIIRTSGEVRLSGFLPWQGVYSELFFTKTNWPALTKKEFYKILTEYVSRERRLGK
ncbi:MAG: polyprenyl diphosphate synthase [Candidatus Paceibacterota bacterium]|jgi:undecaprenyl diphosphate synthase